MAGRRKVHFSLYLSSQLMFGLVSVNNLKASILLDELKTLATRMCSFRSELSSAIDLTEPVSHLRVTLDEPDFDNVPIDFGNFGLLTIFEESVTLPTGGDFFIVSTPQSSGESSSQEGARYTDAGDEHIARVEDVTMQEEAPIPPEEIIVDVQEDRGVVDFSLPHPLETDIVETAVDIQLQDIEPEAPLDIGIDIAPPQRDEVAEEQLPPSQAQLEIGAEQPAIAELEVEDRIPDAPVIGEDAPETRGDEVQRDHPILPSPGETEQRSSSTSEGSFLLPPAPIRGRRRPRRLKIDRRKAIPNSVLKRNAETSGDLIKPLTLPSRLETAESMLSRFGLRAAARGSRRFWPNPRTLPEPNDPARFGYFGVDSITATSDILVEDTVMIDTTMDGSRVQSREEPRAEDTREESREVSQADLSGIPSRMSRISRILQESRDRDRRSVLKTSRVSSIQGITDVPLADLPGIRPEFEDYPEIQAEPEPVVEPQISVPVIQRDVELDRREEELPIETETELVLITQKDTELGVGAEQQGEPEAEQDVPVGKEKKACILPPREEKTPPPPSPSLPRSPLLDRAMMYITEAMNEDGNGQTTFTSVLSRTPRTKVYVAKMFRLLLTLHECHAIIVDQPEPMKEIYIYKGGAFEEYFPE